MLLVSLVIQLNAAQTQQKPAATDAAATACDAERAVQLVRRQLEEAKALASGAQRSAVMTRAAELLWPFDEARALAALAEAFDRDKKQSFEPQRHSPDLHPAADCYTLRGIDKRLEAS